MVRAGDVSFRFGTLFQTWADWTQDPASGGYAQNLYLRRVRFAVVVNLGPNVSALFQLDNPNLGNAGTSGAKALNTGALTRDAFLEWKLAGDRLMLDAGLFYTPQSRDGLTGSAATLSLDTPTFGRLQGALTGSSGGRDVGLALKGYLAGDRLEYRAGAFAGQRQGPADDSAGSRNPPRMAARLQYGFFDPEKGYVYVGTNRGTRKILTVGVWGDTQGDFRACGGDVMSDIPVGRTDAVTAEVDYLYYDGGRQFLQLVGNTITPLLPKETASFSHIGYYLGALTLQPFFRYERLDFRDDRLRSSDQQRFGGGMNWYVAGLNLKATLFYERIVPRAKPAAAAIRDTTHLVIQLQFYYF